MKISEVTINDLKDYANEFSADTEVIKAFSIILPAVKGYIKGYTGLSLEQIDTKEDLTMALFVLANELYDNRQYSVENEKVNVLVKSILDMHSINLL